jgi:hypothetical protein
VQSSFFLTVIKKIASAAMTDTAQEPSAKLQRKSEKFLHLYNSGGMDIGLDVGKHNY